MTVAPFAPDGATYVAHLGPAERAVVRDVLDHVVEILGGADVPAAGPLPVLDAAPVTPPRDPALRRLLPDASRADPELAAEFRRLTEADLRGAKVAHLLRLRDALQGPGTAVVVPPSDAPAFAAAFTDLRLVVAERLGIRTEADAEALAAALAAAVSSHEGLPGADDAADAPAVPGDVLVLAAVNDLLGLLLESLVELMLDELGEGDPDDGPGQRPSAR